MAALVSVEAVTAVVDVVEVVGVGDAAVVAVVDEGMLDDSVIVEDLNRSQHPSWKSLRSVFSPPMQVPLSSPCSDY